jgi:hypothetical protein
MCDGGLISWVALDELMKSTSPSKKKDGEVQVPLCFVVISCKACSFSFGKKGLVRRLNVETIAVEKC